MNEFRILVFIMLSSMFLPACWDGVLVAWGDNGTDADSDNVVDSDTDSNADTDGTDSDSSGCPTVLMGWATVDGNDVATTTGGGTATPVRPTTYDELFSYVSDTAPQVIEIAGTFDLGTEELQISSDKTLLGVDADATLLGGIKMESVNNVIIKNLHIQGAGDGNSPADAVSLQNAHHVWIDHCDIRDAGDGNLDITEASDFVTVSWTRFWYTDESISSRMNSIVGASSEAVDLDSGKLNTTWHHNWFGERVLQAMPRALFGHSHIFNSYYNSVGNSYCIGVGSFAGILIENNYFQDVDGPHRFADSNISHITALNNIYDNTTGERDTGGEAEPFPEPAPYTYSLDEAENVPAIVAQCAGPL